MTTQTNTDDWRDDLIATAGARAVLWHDADSLARAYIQDTPDGLRAQLSTGEAVAAEQIRDRLVGRLTKPQDAAAGRLGARFAPDRLWKIVASDPAWPVNGDGELSYQPGRPRSQTAACSSSEIRLLARNGLFSIHSCITERSLADVLAPGFFSTIAREVERHSQILVVAEASSPEPVHLRLAVDHVDPLGRTVAVRILDEARPVCPVPRRPAATAAPAEPSRDPSGRFQAAGRADPHDVAI